MRLGKTLDLFDRRVWRSWLAKHHATEKEIWLIYVVEGARSRPDMFRQRLQHFLKMTTQNKKFGMVR